MTPAPPVVRVAGLPVTVLRALRFPETANLVTALIDEQEWLATEGDRLADRLHAVIGERAGAPEKPRLVGLRRALHQRRRPRALEWSRALEATLPSDLARRIRDWVARQAAWKQRHAELDPTLAAETERQSTTLRTVTDDPMFRRGLWHASPTLSAELDKWLADPGRVPARQVRARLARYVARAAAKTAVFSGFGVHGFGRWRDDGEALTLTARPSIRATVTLHDFLRQDVIEALTGHPPLRDHLQVRLNPSLTVHAERGWFLGPPPAESINSVPVTDALRRLLGLVGSSKPATLGELRERLTAGGADASAVERLLTHLVDAGLLEVGPPAVAVARSVAGLEAMAGWAETAGAGTLVAGLREVDEGLRTARRVDGDASYRSGHDTVRDGVERLAGELKVPVEMHPLTQDTVVATDPLAECARSPWRTVLADLDTIRPWLAVYDHPLPMRLALAEWWGQRRPADSRIPLLAFYHEVQQEIASGSVIGEEIRQYADGPAPMAALLASPLARVRQLAELRRQAIAAVDVAPGQDGVVQVSPRALAELAATWPQWVTPPSSVVGYLQPVPDGAVLNTLHAGHGKGIARVAYLLDRAGGQVPDGFASGATSDGHTDRPVLAELAQPHRGGLDVHLPRHPYGVDYPHTATDRPAAERLPLSDLWVERDPARALLRLRSERLGVEVVPVHSGLLSAELMPAMLRLLQGAFGAPAPPFGLPVQGWSSATPPGEFRRLPRLRLGSVIVRRAQWVVPRDLVPVRDPGESDGEFLLRITTWRRAHDIPPRCFVRAIAADPTAIIRVMSEERRAAIAARKPFYLDFANWLLVLSFENLLRSDHRAVVFEEALPDPGAVPGAPRSDRVAEVILEVPSR